MNNKLEITLLSAAELRDADFEDTPFFNSIEKDASDFAILLGADIKKDYEYACCNYWCKQDMPDIPIISDPQYSFITTVNYDGHFNTGHAYFNEQMTVCPALKPSQVIKYASKIYLSDNTISAIEFGEYPQYLLATKAIYEKLEELWRNHKLNKTGKVYTTDYPFTEYPGEYREHDEFKPYEHVEYEYKGDRYIRVSGFNHEGSHYFFFENYCSGLSHCNSYWVKVAPIKWRVDMKKDIAISDLGLISGICYHYRQFEGTYTKRLNIKFEDTSIYKYLNTYFAKEIIPLNFVFEIHEDNNMDYSNSYNDTISKKFK